MARRLGLVCVNCGHALYEEDIEKCRTCGTDCCAFCSGLIAHKEPQYPHCDVCVADARSQAAVVSKRARRWM